MIATRALITSCVDCCNVFCKGLSLKTIQMMQIVQCMAALGVMGMLRLDHVTPQQQELAAS